MGEYGPHVRAVRAEVLLAEAEQLNKRQAKRIAKLELQLEASRVCRRCLDEEVYHLLKLLGEELGEAHSWCRVLSDVEIDLVSKAMAAAEKEST